MPLSLRSNTVFLMGAGGQLSPLAGDTATQPAPHSLAVLCLCSHLSLKGSCVRKPALRITLALTGFLVS